MMSEEKEKILPPQAVRISQGSADVPSLVPARSPSISDEGLLAVLPTGAARELTTVVSKKSTTEEIGKYLQDFCDSLEASEASEASVHRVESYGDKSKIVETSSLVGSAMEVDQLREKRKKRATATDDDDSEEVKTVRSSQRSSFGKRRVIRDEEETESVDGSAECFTAATSVIMSSDEGGAAPYISSAQDDRMEQEERIETEVVKRKVGRPKKVRRQALGLVELGVKEIKSDKEDEEEEKYENMSSTAAGSLAIKWLTEVNLIRAKSKNIKGDLSGQMKRRLRKSKNILKSLIIRSEKKGDIMYMKKRNIELESKLRLQEIVQQEKDKEIKVLQSMLHELKNEVGVLKDKIKDLEENKYKTRKDTYWNTKYLQSSGPESEEGKMLRQKQKRRASQESDDLKKPKLDSNTARGNTVVKDVSRTSPKVVRADYEEVGGTGWDSMEIETEPERDNKTEEEKKERERNFPPLPQRHPKELNPRIKVLENIQLRPPLSADKNKSRLIQEIKRSAIEIKKKGKEEETDTDGWERVEKKKKKKVKKDKEIKKQENKGNSRNVKVQQDKMKAKDKRRPPRTAAVTIKGKNPEFSYAEALRKARAEISLKDIGIERTRIRKTVTGGILIQISGNEGSQKAELLAEKLQNLLENEARVALPVIKGELRIVGLDDSVTQEEVKEEIALLGACNVNSVKVGDIKIMRNGLGFIWAQCPLAAAVKVAEHGKIKLGWSVVRVELLKARPKQCFKCWQFGHLRQVCTSDKDYSRLCYKCGSKDHWAKVCRSDPKCVICNEANREANHRLGSPLCKATLNKKESKPVISKPETSVVHKEGADRSEEAAMIIAHD